MTNQPYGPTSGHLPATGEEKTASIFAHLSAIIAAIVTAGWLSFAGPLIIWFIYKDRSPLVRQAAAGSFTINVGLWIMNIVAWICVFTIVLIPVALVLFFIANILIFVFHIIGAVKASRGEVYNYPFQIRILH
jgi:uncharacterized Tic20 family protein